MNREEFMKRIEKIRQEQAKAYDEMDTDRKLMVNIGVLGRRSHAAIDRKGGQNRVLTMLLEQGPMSQRELTHRLGIQPGSASELLHKLEDAYLIERVFDENDRRGKTVRLTENGTVLAESLKSRAAESDGAFSVLNEEEKATLLSLLERVNGDWQKRFPMGPDMRMNRPGGFGPGFHRGPEGFGPGFRRGPEGFGPGCRRGPDGFRRHFDRDMNGDLDRKAPENFRREMNGDLDRIGPGDFEHPKRKPEDRNDCGFC